METVTAGRFGVVFGAKASKRFAPVEQSKLFHRGLFSYNDRSFHLFMAGPAKVITVKWKLACFLGGKFNSVRFSRFDIASNPEGGTVETVEPV